MCARRNTLPLVAATLLAGTLLGAVPALADIAPPVKVRLLGDPRPALPGELFAGELEITSGASAELQNFRLEGELWTTTALDVPAVTKMDKDESLIVAFTAVAADPALPLVFTFEFNGRTVRKSLDLSPEHVARVLHPPTLVRAPGDVQALAPPAVIKRLPAPRPAPPPPGTTTMKKGDGSKRSWWVTVHGRFVYLRYDGAFVGADGATVTVYDEDTGFDEYLASDTTDDQGWYSITFEWDPCFLCDEEPDLYVRFETSNSEVEVEEPTFEINYGWPSNTVDDYTGGDLDFGTLMPNPTDEQAAVHILNSVSRAWRFVWNQGYDPAEVHALWPEEVAGASYSPSAMEIKISSASEWSEADQVHEYGHHWMHQYSASPEPHYCNGLCDLDGCSHCMWCREHDSIAWTEGWPDWFADVVTRRWTSDYLLAPLSTYNFESLDDCSASGALDLPDSTEGFMAALLRDIDDNTQDAHTQYTGFTDALALGVDEIFAVADLDQPLHPLDLLLAFAARYPAQRENLWVTARDCGYEFDQTAPAAPTNITSSHATGVPSYDPTVRFDWARAYDDASGTSAYAILLTAGYPGMPLAQADLQDVTTYTTAPLTPEVPWYFNIRALDEFGRWSGQYASYGPVIIHALMQANLQPAPLEGWSWPLTPRDLSDATPSSVPPPEYLEGDLTATYWNLCGVNGGTEGTGVGFDTHLYVDGAYQGQFASADVQENSPFWGINVGPVLVRGGRHTFEARLDGGDAFVEADEADNRWAHQWIWTPDVIDPSEHVIREAPPDPTAGWDAIVDGSPMFFNCDGLRFSSSAWWSAVTVRALADSVDFDCRLHAAAEGASEGFGASVLALSGRPAGRLDGVIVNRHATGVADWDVSVVNFSGSTNNPYEAVLLEHLAYSFDESLTTSFSEGELIKMWEFYVPPTKAGPVSISLRVDPPGQRLTALWLDSSFQVGSLSDFDAMAITNEAGEAHLDLQIPAAGYNCFVVYRDPIDGAAPVALAAVIGPTPPDLRPFLASGWYAPLVPAPTPVGPPVLPDTLYGNVAETYTYLAIVNDSPTEALGAWAQVHRDGVLFAASYWNVLAPFEDSAFISGSGNVVPGGRHTFTVRLDPFGEIAENNEDNNVCGEQYCWSPFELPMETPVTRLPPPNPTGGWDEVIGTEPFFCNCDGLRLPPGFGAWEGAAVMPAATDDHDLHLHPPLTGAKNGFSSDLATSGWIAGRSDYVLVNYHLGPPRPYDVGVVRFTGSEEYTAEAVASLALSLNPDGVYGPWIMPSGHLLQLREVYLTPGPWAFRLDNATGVVNWGLSLHPAGTPFAGKSDVVENGLAWMNGPGQVECFGVSIAEPGWYCVAVWKCNATDLMQEGTYLLRIRPGVTEVPPPPAQAPTTTALVGIYPNPFNPQALIAFDLAVSSTVRLEIYSPQGARVRTLVVGNMTVGRHEAVWDGRDDDGRRVSSGVYLVRLSAGGVAQSRKLVMLK